MKYTILATRTYDKSLKNVSSKARKHIEETIFVLETNPKAGEALRKELKGFWSLHTKFENTHYRVIYSIEDKAKTVTLRYASSRENIYKQVRRLKLKAA